MDGETIRLLATATGAVIAGLGGALIAGAFNSENTQATIAAARTAAEAHRTADRELEHDRWIRDRKVEVYSQFLEKVHELRLSVAEVQVGYSTDTGEMVKKARDLSLLHLRVLAPRLVLDAAQDVMRAISTLMGELISMKQSAARSRHPRRAKPPVATEAYGTAAEDFRDKITLLELRISHDLGIDVMS